MWISLRLWDPIPYQQEISHMLQNKLSGASSFSSPLKIRASGGKSRINDRLSERPSKGQPLDRRGRDSVRAQSAHTRVFSGPKSPVETKCPMERKDVGFERARPLRPPRARTATPPRAASSAGVADAAMEDLFVKACDLFWAREDESESEVPTFEASDDDADAPARRRRRTQAEVHGTVPTRTSGRIARAQRSESPAAAARPRDVHGEAMPMMTRRLGKGDLTTEERALFFGDVQACLARGETIKAVAQRWGVSEKLYRQLKAKMAVHGTLESRKKGCVGRKKKVTGALYESFVIVNRDARGDKTYRELS